MAFERFVPLFRAMGVSRMLSVNLAKNKKSTLAFAFQNDDPNNITWIGRMIPDGVMDAKIFANYTNVKADNQTMHAIPENMLTGNTLSTHVIFAIDGKNLTLYMVNEHRNNERLVSIEWSISNENQLESLVETWTHHASNSKAMSIFEKVQDSDNDPNCSLS